MILWFGKKKKKKEMEAEGRRIEAEEAAAKLAKEQAEAAQKAAAEATARMKAEEEKYTEEERMRAAEAARIAAEKAQAEAKAASDAAIETARKAQEEATRKMVEAAGAAAATPPTLPAETVPEAAPQTPVAPPDTPDFDSTPEVVAHAASQGDNAFDMDNLPNIVTEVEEASAAAEEQVADAAPIEESVKPVAEGEASGETKKPGFFSKLATGLKRSSSKLSDGITGVFTKRKLDEETLEELEDLLIMSDMGTAVARKVAKNIAKGRFDKEITDDEIKTALASEITEIMRPREQIVDFADGPRPRVVLFVGVNGSGKTTTIGKIASRLKEQGAKALLVAGDTFRAAAIEQLTVWGERAGIPVVAGKPGADAAGLVYGAIERAQREGIDLVLVDTAGRLQNKTELMSELAKVVRVVRKLDPDAPHDVILVLDATVGQNALSQVEAFTQTADVTGLVMTKLDGTAKGGVLVAIAEAHELPIHFVGVGEGADDLQGFSAEAYAKALVGLERY